MSDFGDGEGLGAAIARGDCDVVRALVEGGARIDVRSQSGEYPTSLAIRQEHWQVLRYLLQQGGLLDEEYRLPAAIATSDLARVRASCRSGAANLVDNSGRTPLMYGASARSLDVIELLLQEGADPNLRDRDGKNILYRAAWEADPRVFEILLRAGADPRCMSIQGQTPLMYLLSAPLAVDLSPSHLECVALLLRAGVPLHHPGRPELREPLGYQCALQVLLGFHGFTDGRAQALNCILEHGGEELTRLRGSQALITAVERGYPRAVERLLQAGVSADSQDEDGAAAIVLAVRGGDAPVVGALLEGGACVPALDEGGRLLVRYARDATDPRVAELLAPYNLPVRYPLSPGGLEDAITAADLAGVHELLDAGVNPNGQLPNHMLALSLAAGLGHAAIVSALVARGANVDVGSDRYGSGTAPVLAAIVNSHVECVRILMSHGCDVTSGAGASALWLAARTGKIEVVRLLLEAGADPSVHVHRKASPLLSAVLGRHFQIAEALLAALHDPALRRREIRIALGGSMRELDSRAPFFLLEQDPGICKDQGGRDFVLRTAAWAGNAEVLRQVLASGPCTMHQERPDEGLPLTQAIRSGQLDAVRVLVEAGADVRVADDRLGRTPLMFACDEPSLSTVPEMVTFLLEAGAELDTRARNGQTALMIAVEGGSYSVIQVLLRWGPDLSLRDRQGRDVFDLARTGQRSSVIELLAPLYRGPGPL